MRFPAIYENTIVFTYASDLWVGDLKTGSSRRLTSHQANERQASISPDGKFVAFIASYDGDTDIYVMPLEGGEPKRITYDSYGESFVGWTPDGKIFYASGAGTFTAGQRRLWMVEPTGGLPIETPLTEFNAGTFFAGGQRIAYNRTDSHAYNWRNYRGGRIGTISIYDLSINKYSELPNAGANSWFPMAVGDSIYYLSDRSQKTVNLYKYDSSANKDVQLTRYPDYDIKNPKTDGKSIVYERDGFLYLFDIASGKDRKLTFKIQNDNLSTRPYITKVGGNISSVSILPDASKIAVEARGEIFSIATGNNNAQNLTNTPGIRERAAAWSPNGQSLAYLSDASGEFQIYSKPAGSSEARQISNHRGLSIRGFLWSPDNQRILYYTENFGLFILDLNTRAATQIFQTEYSGRVSFDWSPDGRWIAISAAGKNGLSSIYLYDVKSGKITRATAGLYDDSNVAFDLTGKYLYFTSAREFQPGEGRFEQSLKVEKADRIYLIPLRNDLPNPLSDIDDISPADAGSDTTADDVRIDFDGFAERAILLPVPAGNANAIELIGAKNGVLQNDGDMLRKFDLKSKELQTIYDASGVNIVFNQDRTKAAYFGENILGVFDTKPGIKSGTGKIDINGLEARVVPREEWKQMFWEAWRFERDQFYRADMDGVDWQAVGKHYEQYLPYVNNWSDMRYVLGLMLGELGSSHAYVDDPPPGDSPSNIRPSRAAMLGADFQRNGQWVQFKKIYAGTAAQNAFRAPLGEPGNNVKAGDYLLEIDGQAVNADINPNSLLINKAGKAVTLTINQIPSLQGARKIKVKPVSDETNLRYYEWVEGNRRKVEQLSGGRIGYIHYPNTGRGGQAAFISGFYAQSDKDAIILDGRFNSGGSPQPMVLQTLGRTSVNAIKYRSWVGGTDIAAINGPKVMLTNKYAGSGGDLTPWM
ncbi:MAG TPA: PDZ domain-containing protein, partial [Pyrinomonadaceae bacterium]